MSVNNPSPSPKAKTNMTKPKEPAPASTSTPRPLPPTSPTVGPPQLEKLKELWEAVCGAATPMPKWMLTATQTQMAATLHDTLRLAGGGAASTTAETMNAPATTQRTTTEKAPTPARPDANQKTGRVKAEPPSPPRRFFVDIVRPAPRYLDDKRVDDDVDDESDVGSSIKDEVKLEEDRSLSLFSSSGTSSSNFASNVLLTPTQPQETVMIPTRLTPPNLPVMVVRRVVAASLLGTPLLHHRRWISDSPQTNYPTSDIRLCFPHHVILPGGYPSHLFLSPYPMWYMLDVRGLQRVVLDSDPESRRRPRRRRRRRRKRRVKMHRGRLKKWLSI